MTTFCQFSSLTLSIYIYKNNKVQRFFQQQFLENRLSDLVQIWELSLVCLSLWNRPILISNTTTSCCLYNHLNNDQRMHVTISCILGFVAFCFKIFFALFQRYTRLWLFLIPLQRCHFSEFYKISAFLRPKFHWFLDFFTLISAVLFSAWIRCFTHLFRMFEWWWAPVASQSGYMTHNLSCTHIMYAILDLCESWN